MDTENLVTPVNVKALHNLLVESEYDESKTNFIIDGFTNGFSIGYTGPENIQRMAPNLKFAIGDVLELWNKVMKEVQLKRYAGPFRQVPFKNYIQSPIGLVPKDGGTQTRLIFHLSYPRNGKCKSVNANTDPKLCKVKYPEFMDAIQLCLNEGRFCHLGRSDMRMAFRNLCIRRDHWHYLVMKAKDPETKEWF